MSNFDTLEEIHNICHSLSPMPDDASHVHQAVMMAFHEAGYKVYHEYLVRLPDGRSGRIDVVVESPAGVWAAIEIDARKPRKRSIAKLATGRWLRICCLRGVGEGPTQYPGLDAVIALPVRLATLGEKSRKAPIAAVGAVLRSAT